MSSTSKIPTTSLRPFNLYRSGPVFIAGGLALLLLITLWLSATAVTAIALIGLGSTLCVIERQQGNTALPTILSIHLFAYGSLFLISAGAVWHAAYARPEPGFIVWEMLDLFGGTSVTSLMLRDTIAALKSSTA